MVVRTIRARHSRKTGRVAITFEVDRETLANMRRSAQAGAHPDTLDYIAAVINTAFLEGIFSISLRRMRAPGLASERGIVGALTARPSGSRWSSKTV